LRRGSSKKEKKIQAFRFDKGRHNLHWLSCKLTGLQVCRDMLGAFWGTTQRLHGLGGLRLHEKSILQASRESRYVTALSSYQTGVRPSDGSGIVI